MNKFIRGALLVTLFFTMLVSSALAAYQVGDTVADFELYDAYGNSVKFSDFGGMVVVINFWTPT